MFFPGALVSGQDQILSGFWQLWPDIYLILYQKCYKFMRSRFKIGSSFVYMERKLRFEKPA